LIGTEKDGEGEMVTNLILKITQIDLQLYSPVQIEVFVLHQQELFLKRFKRKCINRTGNNNHLRKSIHKCSSKEKNIANISRKNIMNQEVLYDMTRFYHI
jgi:hypothetical protein